MNIREVLHVVGIILLGLTIAMLPCLALGVAEGLAGPWLAATGITVAAGGALWLTTRGTVELNLREGLAVVGLSWIAIALVGSLPFLLTRTTTDPVKAVFESVSGFTTTGASIFPDVDGLPRSILLWRSLAQWLGGMGIIVLGVAILPLVGMGGAQLFQAEASGITTERLQPRIAGTARRLWIVYAALTAAVTVAFVLSGMTVFDGVNHAMTGLATGGFSTRTASLGAFGSAAQWVAVVAMFLGGVNFTLHARMAGGRWKAWFADTEWRWYAAIAAVTVVAIGATRLPQEGWAATATRDVVFNVVSISTTTGYATSDFGQWSAFAHVVLIGLMFIGGCAGSTAGGVKVVRLVVVARHAAAEVRRVLHPQGVFVTRLGRVSVRDHVVAAILGYLALYMATHAAGTLALTALGQDFITAVSASVSCMSSVGPGLGAVGPAGHYADIGPAAQLVLVVLMLLGRLEFYTLLVLVLPGTWRRAGGDRVLT